MRKALLMLPLMMGVAASPAAAQGMGLGISARGEIRVGYDEVRPEIQILNDRFTDHFGVGDLAYGAELGVDAHVLEGLVVGLYGGIDLSEVDGCEDDIIADGDEGCVDAGNNLYGGVRAGIPTGDGGLIYGKLGLSRGKFAGRYTNAAGTTLIEGSDTVGGWHVGAGFELALTENVYAKAEYVHHRYKHAFADDLSATDQFDPSRHTIMGGIGFRFGGRRVAPEPVYAPPPPPPPPAMRTCPDGTMVDASAACPAPPPPPPPPPPPSPGERG